MLETAFYYKLHLLQHQISSQQGCEVAVSTEAEYCITQRAKPLKTHIPTSDINTFNLTVVQQSNQNSFTAGVCQLSHNKYCTFLNDQRLLIKQVSSNHFICVSLRHKN